jgi:ssDNA-binding Zn-finger/Zn-ribbon topoisomerase 1
MFSHREKLEEPCPKCGQGPDWVLKKMVDSAGRERFPYTCLHCDARTQLFEKKAVAESLFDAEAKPIQMPQRQKAPCERCQKLRLLEKHHWAPYKLFDDADKWPTSMLCRPCHEEWHSKVTGDLIRKS